MDLSSWRGRSDERVVSSGFGKEGSKGGKLTWCTKSILFFLRAGFLGREGGIPSVKERERGREEGREEGPGRDRRVELDVTREWDRRCLRGEDGYSRDQTSEPVFPKVQNRVAGG